MEKIPTGIDGLDKMLGGGFPARRCILLCGGPGSGKTILSWQFLYQGVTQCNEHGLYVSLDEDINHLKEEIRSFGFSIERNLEKEEVEGLGWDLERLEKNKKIGIIDASPIRLVPGEVKIGNVTIGKRDFNLVSLIEIVKKKVKEINAKRIVIDPLTAFSLQYKDSYERRTAVLDLLEALSKLGTTNIVTTELRRVSLERSISPEEFLAHGVIVLHTFVSNKEIIRGLQIEKMRGIAHDNQVRPYKITGRGIVVFPEEEPLLGIDTSISAFQTAR
jgi:KaiC/GvpD/RAD55 family RecA-like ATPase